MEQERYLQIAVSEFPDAVRVHYAVAVNSLEHGLTWSYKDVTLDKGEPVETVQAWIAAAIATAYDNSTAHGWTERQHLPVRQAGKEATDAR